MPLWVYTFNPLALALIMLLGVEALCLVGLFAFRRWVAPRVEFHDGVNDAVSGAVQAIGVFYGITVGLIAVGVWNTWSGASDLVAKEAAAIGALYRDFGAFPDPVKTKLRGLLRDYTHDVIDDDWPAQQQGRHGTKGGSTLDALQEILFAYEPATKGDESRYRETLAAYNRLVAQRRLRLDAVDSGLSDIMWGVIWVGAAISVFVAYFFHLRDWRLHAALIALMGGFLAMVLFLIVVNDKPFYGTVSISSDSYKLLLDTLMART